MKIALIPETEEEKKARPEPVIIFNVAEYVLVGTRLEKGVMPVPVRFFSGDIARLFGNLNEMMVHVLLEHLNKVLCPKEKSAGGDDPD